MMQLSYQSGLVPTPCGCAASMEPSGHLVIGLHGGRADRQCAGGHNIGSESPARPELAASSLFTLSDADGD